MLADYNAGENGVIRSGYKISAILELEFCTFHVNRSIAPSPLQRASARVQASRFTAGSHPRQFSFGLQPDLQPAGSGLLDFGQFPAPLAHSLR